jgi:type IV pilus assembly protein PilQ
MMKRIPFVFAAALLMAALLYQPIAAAQGGADSVDASIDAILNSPAPAAEPAAAPSPVIAAAVESAPAEAPVAEEIVEKVAEEVVAEAPAAVVAEAPAPTEPPPAEPEASPEVSAAAPPTATMAVESEPASAMNENGEVLVSMEFDEAPLPDVIRAFREASGATIISRWTNAAPQLVSLRLENKPWKQGLISILAPYGLQLVEEQRGSGVYVVSEKSTVVPRFTQTFELKHLKAGDVQKLFKDTLGDASSLTVAFPSANAVVVKATDEQLRECEKMLDVLDKPSRQVYIEARFVRLNSSASKQLGMKWDSLKDWGVEFNNIRGGLQYTDGDVAVYDVTTRDSAKVTTVKKTGALEKHDYNVTETTSSLIPEERTDAPLSDMTADDMTWHKASGFGGQLSVDSLRIALSAFEQMDGVQMFSNPKIIVENETTAKIDMTTKEPNVEIDYQAATQAGQRDSISSKLVTIPGKKESWVGEAFFSYGITLDVTPRVSPTGLITVDIVPAISSLDDNRVIPLGENAANYYPIIKMQRLETRFTMGDGKTAVIGGLTQTSEGNIDSGIPLLRTIPWIGPRLFGWKSREKIQDEIIIFVTVGIVDGETIEQSGGMPKNAVLGRGLLDGSLKEPGDRTDAEMFNLETKPKGYRIK